MKTTTLTDTNANAAAFLEKLTAEYSSYKDTNIIVDLSVQEGLQLSDVLGFLSLSDKHRKSKKSFVLVVTDFDIDDAPEELIIVPTLQEAHDVIEMEEIERDLGF
ncbi:ribonuclease Z [Flavobacterium sp. RHBU_24]|uniref:ribonuclease Z n=1 Tax=Flavobacterium sp. RHBU_24 TaxID=3391185 RepID=UPI00398536B7